MVRGDSPTGNPEGIRRSMEAPETFRPGDDEPADKRRNGPHLLGSTPFRTMNAHLLGLEIPDTGILAKLSEAHPAVRIEAWSIGSQWLAECRGPAESLTRILEALPPAALWLDRAAEKEAVSVLIQPSSRDIRSLDPFSRIDAILIPPLEFRGGRLTVRVLTRRDQTPADVLGEYPDARLVVKRALSAHEQGEVLRASGGILPMLTRSQSEAVLAAVEAGYYDVPRRCTVADIARPLGIARSTAEEHLRAGESVLVRGFSPLLRLGRSASVEETPARGGEDLQQYARFSEAIGLYVRMAVRDERVAGVTFSPERPRAARRRTHPYLSRILHHLATGEDDLRDIPLDLKVTPFERRVIDEIRQIPIGQTATYREIAERLGHPKATRAVGNACAGNPAVVVVPCHRVVPSAGGLGNYSGAGGTKTKSRILEREGAIAEPRNSRSPPGLAALARPVRRGRTRPRLKRRLGARSFRSSSGSL